MERIETRMILPMVVSLICLSAAVGCVYAGDYYTYRDSSGRLVLADHKPPPGSRLINAESLPEATDGEIAEAQARVGTAGLDYRLSNLERAVGDMEYNLRAQPSAVDNVHPDYGEGGGLIVGVTNGFVRPRHPPMRRPGAPPPSSLPGGKIPPGSLPGGKIPAGSLPGGKLG